jgi:PTS system mannitol-specific IIA component
MEVLTNVAMVFSDESNLERIMNAKTEEEIAEILEGGMEG